MPVLLNALVEARFGLMEADRRDFALLFGDPWWLVKKLLGHADVETTKRHYLAPVADLELESILAAAGSDDDRDFPTEGLDEVLARLARESQCIQDIGVLVAERVGG